MPTQTTIHQAGPLVDLVQTCTRCDAVLTDYRGAMVEEGSGPLRGWADGAHVEVRDYGGMRESLLTTDQPTCHELERK